MNLFRAYLTLTHGFPLSVCKFIQCCSFLYFIVSFSALNQAIPSLCVCRKLISSVCFAKQPLCGFFLHYFQKVALLFLHQRRGLMCSQPTKHCSLISLGLGQPVQPAHSSAHSRLGVMKICIYIVPCMWHDGIAVGGSAWCQKVTCVPDLMS